VRNDHRVPERIDLLWEGGGYGPRKHRKPLRYSAFVPDPILEWDPRSTVAATHAVAEATSALSALLSAAEPLVDVFHPPLQAALLRSEALGSSFIEGLHTSSRQLALAEHNSQRATPTVRAVLGNIEAMQRAIERSVASDAPLTVDDIVDVHHALLNGTTESRFAGVIRHQQNWIGGTSFSPRDAEFVPPPPDRLPELLADLVGFCNRTDLPAITQAAAAHAQFETLHPFGDGNGRAGRCLIHLVLGQRGLEGPLRPPISLVLARDKHAYITGLTAFREGKPDHWIGSFADSVSAAVAGVHSLLADLADLQADLMERAGNPRRDSAAALAISLIASHTVWSASLLAAAGETTKAASRNALNRLESSGVLSPLPADKSRERHWISEDVFALLDRFERRLRLG